jgi:hypothetical protein
LIERQRALSELTTKDRCPGEKICVSDPYEGIISQMEGETLETYCNPKCCRLYHTKKGVIPVDYEAFLEAAVTIRQERLAGNPPRKLKEKYWRYRAYMFLEYARYLIRAENQEKLAAEAEADPFSNNHHGRKSMEPVTNTIAQQMKNSDSGAFSAAMFAVDDED